MAAPDASASTAELVAVAEGQKILFNRAGRGQGGSNAGLRRLDDIFDPPVKTKCGSKALNLIPETETVNPCAPEGKPRRGRKLVSLSYYNFLIIIHHFPEAER